MRSSTSWLARQASNEELGGKLSHTLANRLRISRGEAGRRIREADDLGPRQSVTREPLPPRPEATGAAQRDGQIGNPGNELCSAPTDARVMGYQEIGDASPSTASRPAYCGD